MLKNLNLMEGQEDLRIVEHLDMLSMIAKSDKSDTAT